MEKDRSLVANKFTVWGRTIRTLVQGFVGLAAVFLASDSFRDFITNNAPELAVYIPGAIAFVTWLQNRYESRKTT